MEEEEEKLKTEKSIEYNLIKKGRFLRGKVTVKIVYTNFAKKASCLFMKVL